MHNILDFCIINMKNFAYYLSVLLTNGNFAIAFGDKITKHGLKAYILNKITYYYGQTGKELR